MVAIGMSCWRDSWLDKDWGFEWNLSRFDATLERTSSPFDTMLDHDNSSAHQFTMETDIQGEIYTNLGKDTCNIMYCNVSRSIVLLHSIRWWEQQVSWNGQKFKDYSSCVAITYGSRFHTPYHSSNSWSDWHPRKLRLWQGEAYFWMHT